jgi:hypothetical protein
MVFGGIHHVLKKMQGICEKMFQKDWCASFGLSKTMAIYVVH